MRIRAAAVAAGAAAIVLIGSPSYAHDCFNPQKDAHAPMAGVNYVITGFGPDGPVFEQVGHGKGIGGFVEIAPGVFGPDAVFVHSLGNSSEHSGKDEVGGPGSMKAEHACDGKGIDYLDACAGG
jgi:hypothetical protein